MTKYFEQRLDEENIKSKKVAWWAFTAMTLVCFALTITIMRMTPLKRTEVKVLVVDKNTGKLQRENIKETKEEGASMNTLYFDNLPLEEIAPVLARSFDVLIDVAKSVRSKRFYLIFNKQISNIDQILQIMAQTGQIKYNMANGRYRLY